MPPIAIDPTLQPPHPWPPEQAQPGVSKPCRTRIKFNDTQLVLLSAAWQRDDHPGSADRSEARPGPEGRSQLSRSRAREGDKGEGGSADLAARRGDRAHVMILDKGFAWNGETYGSLSQVAKAMTGTSWNGHRFFGLQRAGSTDPQWSLAVQGIATPLRPALLNPDQRRRSRVRPTT